MRDPEDSHETPRSPSKNRPSSGIIVFIAVFRLVKAVLLIAVGLATLRLLRPGAAVALRSWMDALPFASEHEIVHRIAVRVTLLPRKRIDELAVAAFSYAALFIVEGTGLLMGKVWAEHLTLVATASFIPFEIYEVMQKPSMVRVCVLIINIAILVYLIARRWRAHRAGGHGGR